MRVEFLGVPRERAGISEFEIEAETLEQLLATLETRFPALADLMGAGRLPRFVAVNLNGDRFVTDPQTRFAETDCVLILSADAGG